MTNLSNIEIAKLTAQIEGGGFKRSASKEAAIKKFEAAAAKAGMVDLDQILGLNFTSATEAVDDFKSAMAEPKPAKSKKAPTADKPARTKSGKRAEIEAAAASGTLPTPPDFSANTHKAFRPKLAAVVALAEAGDLAGLEAFEIKAYSSSPKAILKYRDLAILALKAKGVPATPAKRLTEMKVDEYNDSIIAAAAKYVATRKIGPGKFDTREAPTESEIREIAASMGAGTMINAINAAGRQALIGTIR
jgi:hypothetical protein